MAKWGEPQAFIDHSLTLDTNDCIFWPFGSAAQINKNGKILRVTRIICEKVYGPPPSRIHQAAHSCGNGDISCINWKHLSWKTPKENNIDMVMHGMLNTQKLSKNEILQIRELYGKMKQPEIAKKFNVSLTTIESILARRTWSYVK
jgi:hypothetical protein